VSQASWFPEEASVRTEICVVLVVAMAIGASGCSVLDCKFEDVSDDVTVGDPYAEPAVPVVDAPSCGNLGDTERGTVYRFGVVSVEDKPACFAEGRVSGVQISDVVVTGNPPARC